MTAIVNNIDQTRYVLKREGSAPANNEEKKKAISSSDSEDNEDDKDSIFDDEENDKAAAICYLEDSQKNNRRIGAGNKVKLQIVDVQVSEGSIISYAVLI